MALIATAAAGIAAAVPMVTLGILNYMDGKSAKGSDGPISEKDLPSQPVQPERTRLIEQSDARPPAEKIYSVLDDPTLFPSQLASSQTRPTDLYRDPFTQQLYQCTENDAPFPDTDTDLNYSGTMSDLAKGKLNGLVGNERIHRQEDRGGRDWSNDMAPDLMRNADVSHTSRMQHAFRAVDPFKRDGYRPEGTGYISRESIFGANMHGLNTYDTGAIRRGIVNPYNLKEEVAPIDTSMLGYSSRTDAHGPIQRAANVDIGQLRTKRGAMAGVSMAGVADQAHPTGPGTTVRASNVAVTRRSRARTQPAPKAVQLQESHAHRSRHTSGVQRNDGRKVMRKTVSLRSGSDNKRKFSSVVTKTKTDGRARARPRASGAFQNTNNDRVFSTRITRLKQGARPHQAPRARGAFVDAPPAFKGQFSSGTRRRTTLPAAPPRTQTQKAGAGLTRLNVQPRTSNLRGKRHQAQRENEHPGPPRQAPERGPPPPGHRTSPLRDKGYRYGAHHRTGAWRTAHEAAQERSWRISAVGG